ncbi:probable cytochrome P450 4d14 [Anopheles ziemanni]|uniref:probable cytochrome P450 4d14 n=1 Tax=Anopheles coustani TaxID=139045 RepID=UPI00265AD623|nr:probable cytochrome P450 4d14 [Anopheles coustani]XP_058169925.1 probable cytochrome P450 4d14 [Anopheles ziemanni]
MMLYVAIVVVYLSYLLFKYHQKRQHLFKVSSHFKGPHPDYFLGCFYLFRNKSVPEIFDMLYNMHIQYGADVPVMGAFNDFVMDITGSENVEKVVLAKTTKKSFPYDFLEPWLGTGLLLSFGEKWFQRRRIITPTFHFKMLDQFVDVFNHEADVLVSKLEARAGKGEFNIYDYITLYALDSICTTSMGVQINAQEDPNNEYAQGVKQMSEFIFRRVFSVFRQFPSLFFLYPFAREQGRVIKKLHNFTNTVIEKRRQQLQAEQAVGQVEFNADEEDLYSKRRDTFLDQLLKVKVDGKPLSTADIREEVDTFMFEGHDTTTSGISFTILNLAKHQDIQQKVFEEIDGMLGANAKSTELTSSLLQEMKYLDMVIKESLRIVPPVPFIGRKLLEDMEMNGTVIPAGTTFSLNIFSIHRNPKVFPEPEKFIPERFSDDNDVKRGPYDYIPFSAGFRNCIGQKYALLEMKVTIVKLLASYRILPGETTDQVRYKADLVLRPTCGIPVKLVKRV